MTFGTTQPAHGRKPPDLRHGARIYTDTTLTALAIRHAARSTPQHIAQRLRIPIDTARHLHDHWTHMTQTADPA